MCDTLEPVSRPAFMAAVTTAAEEYLGEAEDHDGARYPSFTDALTDFGAYLSGAADLAHWGREPGPGTALYDRDKPTARLRALTGGDAAATPGDIAELWQVFADGARQAGAEPLLGVFAQWLAGEMAYAGPCEIVW